MQDRTRIPTTAQLRTLEAAWIKACHANWGLVLMESAGLGATHLALSLLDDMPGKVVVVCGSGNNGGDGFVVARHLRGRDIALSVHVVSAGNKGKEEGEASINKKILVEKLGLPIHEFDEDSLDYLESEIEGCALIVDALLGTGLDREVGGAYAEAIELINSSGKPVLSIDLPSGINSDTGAVMGIAVEADITATFGYLKAGLLHYPGAEHAGVIALVDIGLPNINDLPAALHQMAGELESPTWWLSTHAHVREWLPPRRPDGHKGTFGRVAAIAGSRQMTGSCMLAARSVLRSGAGYAVLATAESVITHLPPEEIVYRAVSETAHGGIAVAALPQLLEEIKEADAVLLGPGLGSEDDITQLVDKLLQSIEHPCLIDADGLNAISRLKNPVLKNPSQVVITPHPKELERLIGIDTAKIQADRIGAARMAVEKFGCNVVLKGAHTVVATADGGVYIVPTGNSGMATPGAGDVLSGIIAAFLAEGMPACHAAVAGAYVHGAAGDLAADNLGEDGMVAHDILNAIPSVLAEIRDGDFNGRQIEAEVLS